MAAWMKNKTAMASAILVVAVAALLAASAEAKSRALQKEEKGKDKDCDKDKEAEPKDDSTPEEKYERLKSEVEKDEDETPRQKKKFLKLLKSRMKPAKPPKARVVEPKMGRSLGAGFLPNAFPSYGGLGGVGGLGLGGGQRAAGMQQVGVQDKCQQCGIPNYDALATRIVNGTDALDNEFPWTVALKISVGGTTGIRCGGSILSYNFVLTAAHCIWNTDIDNTRRTPEELEVIPGLHDVRRAPYIRPIKVISIVLHPGYKGMPSGGSDAAILQLAERLQWKREVRPACLPPADGNKFEGKRVTYAGWGNLRPGESGGVPEKLQKVTVSVITNHDCQRMYKKHTIDDSMMCTLEKHRDACQGDSGGPLILPGKEPGMDPGRMYLVGAVSWGEGCANFSNPGVVFRINNFLDWIKQVTAADPPCFPPAPPQAQQ